MKIQIDHFDAQFASLHQRSMNLVKAVPEDLLFLKPLKSKSCNSIFSFGELILRSAGKVEQTFGGITTRLWDDPFEWTLPEELSTNVKIIQYLKEVEDTRKNGFGYFTSDSILLKEIPAPETMKTLKELLLQTIACAEKYFDQSFAVYQELRGENECFESKT